MAGTSVESEQKTAGIRYPGSCLPAVLGDIRDFLREAAKVGRSVVGWSKSVLRDAPRRLQDGGRRLRVVPFVWFRHAHAYALLPGPIGRFEQWLGYPPDRGVPRRLFFEDGDDRSGRGAVRRKRWALFLVPDRLRAYPWAYAMAFSTILAWSGYGWKTVLPVFFGLTILGPVLLFGFLRLSVLTEAVRTLRDADDSRLDYSGWLRRVLTLDRATRLAFRLPAGFWFGPLGYWGALLVMQIPVVTGPVLTLRVGWHSDSHRLTRLAAADFWGNPRTAVDDMLRVKWLLMFLYPAWQSYAALVLLVLLTDVRAGEALWLGAAWIGISIGMCMWELGRFERECRLAPGEERLLPLPVRSAPQPLAGALDSGVFRLAVHTLVVVMLVVWLIVTQIEVAQ